LSVEAGFRSAGLIRALVTVDAETALAPARFRDACKRTSLGHKLPPFFQKQLLRVKSPSGFLLAK
jgi:hypothetical protein